MIETMPLPSFECGEKLRARKLNQILTVLRQCEVALEHVPQRRAHVRGARRADAFRVYPWEVRLAGGDAGYAVLVRAGAVVVRWVLRGSEENWQASTCAVLEWPFGECDVTSEQAWQELRVPMGMECFDVWLVCRGEVSAGGVVPQEVTQGALEWRLEVLEQGKVPQSPLRVWLLASVDVRHAAPVTQHVWGELDMCEVRGLLAADGSPVLPEVDGALPSQFESVEGYKVLAAMKESGTGFQIDTAVKAALDGDGFLRLVAGEEGVLFGEDDGGGGDDDVDPPDPPPPDDDDEEDDDNDDGSDNDGGDDEEEDEPPPGPDGPLDGGWPPGYWFVSGDGVTTVTPHRTSDRTVIAYDFTVKVYKRQSGSATAKVAVALPCSVSNPSGSYDYPQFGITGLTMFCGISGAGAGYRVSWQSSLVGGDGLPKSCTAHNMLEVKVKTAALMSGTAKCHSEGLPGFGNGIKMTFLGEKRRTEAVRVWEGNVLVTKRMSRVFRRYKLSVDTKALQGAAVAAAQNSFGSVGYTVSPASVSGSSSGLSGPKVTAGTPSGSVMSWSVPAGVQVAGISGPFKVKCTASVGGGSCNFGLSGAGSWNSGTCSGSIGGTFTVKAMVKV